MKTRYWVMEASLLFLISSVLVPLTYTSSGESGPLMADPNEGPFLWSHSGPVTIDELEYHFSMGEDIETEYRIVQFDGPIRGEDIRKLEDSGLSVLDYFPDYAFVVRISGDELPALPDVVGTSPFYQGLKVHPDILREIAEGEDPFLGFGSVTVETFTSDSIENDLMRSGHFFERTKDTRYVVDLPADMAALINIDGVKWIEPRSEMVIQNNVADGIIDVDIVRGDLGLDGSGQMVGISDTGLDTGVDDHDTYGDIHLDIDDRATISDWSGSGPDDDDGHGTHVTGSVAGDGSRSNGNIRGMAHNSTVYFQALETDAGYLNTPSNLSRLFTQAYEGGARIHTNSWGASSSSLFGAYTAESYDVDWSMFNDPDMLILFAAGNNGEDSNSDGKIDLNSVSPPSTAKSAMTVGASENLRGSGGYQGSWGTGWPSLYPSNPINSDRPSNNSRGLAAFSARGPLDDGRLKPDLVAPGTNVLSMRSSVGSSPGWGPYNSSYIYYGGTSMSTPITAGMAALVREYYNRTLGIGSPSAALLKATMINGATDISPGQYGASSTVRESDARPDMSQGWGRINLKDSIDPDDGALAFIDNRSGLSTGENLTRMFRVISPEQDLRLSLAWSDHPGSLFAGKQLINDLDLIVTAPNGTVYRGNDFTAPFGDTSDTINPVEGVQISDPSVGWWRVEVDGSNVPRGPQHFAVAATGNMTPFIMNEMVLDRYFYSTDNDNISISLTSSELTGLGNISVMVNSTSYPSGKNVTLLEEGDMGGFRGHVITRNATTTEPGEIFVSDGDMIRVSYDSPFGINFSTKATAKRPMRVALVRLMENLLVYSTGDELRLKGYGDPSLDVLWKIQGSSMPWMGIYDDGLSEHGDPVAGDGEYNTRWILSEDYVASGDIILMVEDPYLGSLEYRQFPLSINSSRPGAPSDLEATPNGIGNTVDLEWNGSVSGGIDHHNVYINSTPTPSLDPSDWQFYMETGDASKEASVRGLADGTAYSFRVQAVLPDGAGSSLSFPDSAVPFDDTPPTVTYDGIPEIITGEVPFEFTADDDLKRIELQYYHDANGDGEMNDNSSFLWADNSTSDRLIWDTRSAFGGPGDLDKVILRFRGRDEVPNISNWTYMAGFGIDNTGPVELELITFPPRVTNATLVDITGATEPLALVIAEMNGELIGEMTAGINGFFDMSLELDEGPNYLNMTAFDLHGAGPITRNYTFTRDTSSPVARIRNFTTPLEIRCNCSSILSDSFDRGIDPDFSVLSNQTWTLTGPYGSTLIRYGSRFDHIFDISGIYHLQLVVKDRAMNRDSDNVTFEVVDLTSPVVNIHGPDEVNEDTTYEFSMLGSTDNDPTFSRPGRRSVEWTFSGPKGFVEGSDSESPYVLFPEPGEYGIILNVTDAAGNTGSSSRTIMVADITPPSVEIEGDSILEIDRIGEFNVSVEDNNPLHPNMTTYSWELRFQDRGGEMIAASSRPSFSHNFSQPGNYTLILSVTDPEGNRRNDSMKLLVKTPFIASGDIQEEKEEPFIPWPYIVFGGILIGAVVLIIGGSLIARRNRYDEVDAEWEEDVDDWEDEEDWEDWDEDDEWDEEW